MNVQLIKALIANNVWAAGGAKTQARQVGQRRLGGTASTKTSRPSGRSRAKAKDGNGLHSKVLSRMDGIGSLLRRTWACGTGGSRRERKPSITPGDARTSTDLTCGASARQVDLCISYVCNFVLFCFFAIVFICFLPVIYIR